ncbi:MAG TPA: MFS transporter [Burkholderiales bacterium]|nr:MFS transporter [Burkholderiales bacterium]
MTFGYSSVRGWLESLRVYAEPRVARMLLLGFSAGLPLLLVLGTLSYRLREAGIDRTTIGFLSWVGLAYGLKWAWAPLVDRLPLPLLTRALGRRRSWLLAAQLVLVAGLAGMGFTDAAGNLPQLVGFALLVAFASATQDIALDAFRIESADVTRQAAMAAAYQVGYRIAMITASAGTLWVAAAFDPDETTYQNAPWAIAYLCMAGLIGIGMATVLLSTEPQAVELAPRREGLLGWIRSAVLGPFQDFVQRYRWTAVLLLALIATYRISDIVLGVMSNPFYRDMGFTKDEVAAISGVYGVAMTLVGAGIGGVLCLRYGVMRILLLGAALSSLTNLLFAWLATRGHDVPALVLAISADNLSAGIASAAFIAYLSGLTNVAYSATQYALFSSIMLLLPKFVGGWSGLAVDSFGYAAFFIGTAVLGIPVLVLAWLASRSSRQATMPGGGG